MLAGLTKEYQQHFKLHAPDKFRYVVMLYKASIDKGCSIEYGDVQAL